MAITSVWGIRQPIWLIVLLLVCLTSLAGLLLMGLDKSLARHQRQRVPERVFFVLALLGGSAGILAGIWLFRHKTRHRAFTWFMPVLLLMQLAACLVLMVKW